MSLKFCQLSPVCLAARAQPCGEPQSQLPRTIDINNFTIKLADPFNHPTMTKFCPCIDLHSGQVKQIVGGTLTTTSEDLKTNFISKLPAGHFAKLYKDNGLGGAHVIMLGPGNEEAAKEALAEWPGGLQVGGGITDKNAKQWIEWGAERVCEVPRIQCCSCIGAGIPGKSVSY